MVGLELGGPGPGRPRGVGLAQLRVRLRLDASEGASEEPARLGSREGCSECRSLRGVSATKQRRRLPACRVVRDDRVGRARRGKEPCRRIVRLGVERVLRLQIR